MPAGIRLVQPAQQEVFTGLEGLITPADLEAARRARQSEEAKIDRTQLSGTRLGARRGGAALGRLLQRVLPETEQQRQAQVAQDAITAARTETRDLEFDGPTAMFDQRLAVVGATIRNLEEKGLGDQADALRANMIQLQRQKLSFQREAAQLDATIQSTAGAKISNELKDLELQAAKGGDFGRDELTRMQNRLAVLDPNDPTQAAQIDQINDRINKLTLVTGRTQFDVADKTLFRNSVQDMANTRDALDRLNGIADTFNPTYLTVEGKVKNWALKTKDILGLELSENEKQSVQEYTTWRARTGQNLSLYIKEITGAQMSIQEAQRLIKDLPNDADSPSQFQSKLEDSLLRLEAAHRRANQVVMLQAEGDVRGAIEARAQSLTSLEKQIQGERDEAELSDLEARLGITREPEE